MWPVPPEGNASVLLSLLERAGEGVFSMKKMFFFGSGGVTFGASWSSCSRVSSK